MSNERVENSNAPEPSRRSPWLFLIGGLLATFLAWVFCLLPGVGTPLRVGMICAGLLSAALALTQRPPSPRLLISASFVTLFAQLATDPAWDTVRLVLRIAMVVALVGAGLVALPQRRRRAVVSVLVVVYFAGLLSAVTAMPHSSWLADQARARFYRPFLEFLHLTETYQWFAPEAGPEPLLWFRLEYADGTARWIKIRNREDYRTNLEYARFGSLATWAHQSLPPSEDFPEELVERRRAAGKKFKPPIPMPNEDLATQYQEPTPETRFILAAYARHVAHSYPHATDPDQAVTGVKIYSVLRSALEREDVSDGRDPLDPTLLSPHYQGEFDADGNLKRSSFHVEYDGDGNVMRQTQDPFLYWLIPMQREEDGAEFDYVKVHAGDFVEKADR